MPSHGGFGVTIDPQQWHKFKQDLDRFDPELARALRRRIKKAGDVAVQRVKERLSEPLPTDGRYSAGRRQTLAAATRVTVSFGRRQAGSRIVTSASGLDAAHKVLLNVYNKTSFRHPVYPGGRPRDKWSWASQEGRPYFGSAIMEAVDKELTAEIFAAVDDAAAAIGGKGPL